VIHFIVFSRNRPLQLHGYLTSLISNLSGSSTVDVLVAIDAEYADAYSQVQTAFDTVRFFEQSDSFARDMLSLTTLPSDYICFGCDDVVFQRPIDMNDVDELLTRDERLVGISLRLGRHITHGMFGNQQPQPAFESDNKFLTWDMNAATGDWSYPWDVLGTIYRHQFVQDVAPHLQGTRNPSQYEDIGSRAWATVSTQHHYACWPDSRTTVPTPNVVQREFGNGYIGHDELDPAFLLSCWQHNLRMDIERFTGVYQTWRIGDFHLTRV
jgi:hypothetical protein